VERKKRKGYIWGKVQKNDGGKGDLQKVSAVYKQEPRVTGIRNSCKGLKKKKKQAEQRGNLRGLVDRGGKNGGVRSAEKAVGSGNVQDELQL